MFNNKLKPVLIMLLLLFGSNIIASDNFDCRHSDRIERIPCDTIGKCYGDNQYYKTVIIFYNGIVPYKGGFTDCNCKSSIQTDTDEDIPYLDISTAVSNSAFGYPIIKPNQVEITTPRDIYVKIMDMCTGKMVIEEFVPENEEFFKENIKKVVNKLITVPDLRHKIDIIKLPKNTAYFLFLFNTNNELLFVDRIRFGYWDYNKIIKND